MSDKTAPTVFISYSHDSPEHKRWVAKLATDLRNVGINAVLDQWDLAFGADIPKFMERGLTSADRVLVVCTETYVRKANDGTGGVGYETMIVTAELVQDLGTSKFIPVVRQKSELKSMPLCLGARYYIEFSNDAEYDQQFEQLAMSIHDLPVEPKPPFGKNPFAEGAGEQPISPTTTNMIDEVLGLMVTPDSVHDLYRTCLRILSAKDLVSWRKLVQRARADTGTGLNQWLEKYRSTPPSDEKELIERFFEAARVFEPLICMALSGVESGIEQFRHQVSILDSALYIKDWNPSGLVVATSVPRGIVLILQAVLGAAAMQTNQIDLAYELATAPIRCREGGEARPLWRNPDLIGWSPALTQKVTVAWHVLVELPRHWDWLQAVFGSTDEYVVALTAYYAFLTLIEYIDIFDSGNEGVLEQQNLELEVPWTWVRGDTSVIQRACSLITANKKAIRGVLPTLLQQEERLTTGWPKWIAHGRHWLLQVYRFPLIEMGNLGALLPDLMR